jgi:hypothetical protein
VLERNLLSRLWRYHPRVFKGLELNVTAKSHISDMMPTRARTEQPCIRMAEKKSIPAREMCLS